MKKLIYLIVFAALVLNSCTQELPGPDPNALQEVIFTTSLENGGFKSDPFNCDNPEADYAAITLQAGTPSNPIGDAFVKQVPTFYVDGILYTQAIKLKPGEYTVLNFLLYADGAGEEGEDLLVNAVPEYDSEFGALVANPLPQPFLVSSFSKIEVPLGILCFEPSTYKQFGFAWFRVDETVARQKWFFGDFCTKFFKEYEGSLYGDDPKVDMPAIFNIGLYYDDNKNGGFEEDELIGNYDNEADYMTSGAPMSLNYLDPAGTGDLYELRISIYVKTGNDDNGDKQFGYKTFGSWFFTDESDDLYTNAELTDGFFDAGDDGVYDFVMGNCNAEAADFAFAPYMNLPESASLEVNSDFGPGPIGGAYLDITLSGFNSGFDIEANLWYGSYCFDQSVEIGTAQSYEVTIFSSLNKQILPISIRDKKWEEVNWLANHFEDFPGYTWKDVQQAIWELDDNNYQYSDNNGTGVPADELMVNRMVAAAKLNGPGYVPMPGGWAAVTFIKTEDLENNVVVPSIQTVFIIVDP
ncbi:MAG: hypothetical protein KAH17_01840 [Bacteroidales bacterium]|nr:hypothetical protein [Bacteroidales bacterium]